MYFRNVEKTKFQCFFICVRQVVYVSACWRDCWCVSRFKMNEFKPKSIQREWGFFGFSCQNHGSAGNVSVCLWQTSSGISKGGRGTEDDRSCNMSTGSPWIVAITDEYSLAIKVQHERQQTAGNQIHNSWEAFKQKVQRKGRSGPIPLKNRRFKINAFIPNDGIEQTDLYDL